MKRKIAYVSGTRADYGLMSYLLKQIDKDNHFSLQLYTTGMHLMTSHGYTHDLVSKTFPETKMLPAYFENDSQLAFMTFFSTLLKLLSEEFASNRPDIALLLGDRIEMLATAIVCLYMRIPTAHIHGGDISTTVDDSTRHAITKLAHLHFPATHEAQDRIIKMGEEPWRIHLSGAPGLDSIMHKQLPTNEELSKVLQIQPDTRFILVTLQPISEDIAHSGHQMKNVLEAACTFKMPVIVIYPNNDPGSSDMIDVIEQYRSNSLVYVFKNIDYSTFLAMERDAIVWIGNSSAGIIESGSFKTPVINIGPRQNNRTQGDNIINTSYKQKDIQHMISYALQDGSFKNTIKDMNNPWGTGQATKIIMEKLSTVAINDRLLNKKMTY